jgi:hypothetical protein
MTAITTRQTDWAAIPTIEIDVSQILDPNEIKRIFKKHKIDKYLYRIMYKGIVIKFGMSADNAGDWGERVARQIAHGSFWDKDVRNNGNSGADWRVIEELFEELYGIGIEKNGLTVKVWDMTNYPFDSIDEWHEVKDAESELIQKYIDSVGQQPIGNLTNEFSVKKQAKIKKTVAQNLFEGLVIKITPKRNRKKKD